MMMVRPDGPGNRDRGRMSVGVLIMCKVFPCKIFPVEISLQDL